MKAPNQRAHVGSSALGCALVGDGQGTLGALREGNMSHWATEKGRLRIEGNGLFSTPSSSSLLWDLNFLK